MTRNRILMILGIVLVLVVLTAVRHRRVAEKNQAPLLPQVATAVQVEAVRRGPLESVDHVLGEVRGADEDEIAPRVSGEVRKVLVREGDRVARGAVLARLDTQELDDALAAAEADVEAMRVAHEAQVASTSRDRVLFENSAISQEQWEHSQAAQAAAAARFEVARRHRDQAQARLGPPWLGPPSTVWCRLGWSIRATWRYREGRSCIWCGRARFVSAARSRRP